MDARLYCPALVLNVLFAILGICENLSFEILVIEELGEDYLCSD